MRVLITGAAGGVGTYLIEEFKGLAQIVGFDARAGESADVEWHVGDITDVDALTEAATGCDVVIHLAGIPVFSEEMRVEIGRVNMFGTQVVLDAAVRAKVTSFVQASSICAAGFIFWSRKQTPPYFPIDEDSAGTPDDIYGLGKSIDEQLAAAYSSRYGIRTTNLRMATVWRPESTTTEGELAVLLTPEMDTDLEFLDLRWQYVDVRDVAQAFRLVVESGESFGTMNVGAADCPGGDWRVWLQDIYPDTPTLRSPAALMAAPEMPLWSIDKIVRELGYRPEHKWTEYPTFVKAWKSYLDRRASLETK